MLAILQFDSPALPLLERMLGEGRLPALAGLRERGGWQTIDTAATILQSATYPTLCTGIDVREHGLYSAFPWSAADQRVRYLHTWPHPRTIWERLTERGRRSLIVDPYLAWTPRSMAGVYLNGWAFEDRIVTPGRSVPRRARGSLARRHGRPPQLDDVYGRRRAAAFLALREHLVAAPSRTADAAIELLRAEPFDLVWLNFSASHKAGHHLFDPASVIEEPLSPDEAQTLGAGLEDVYAAVDAAVGRIVDSLPEGADLIVFAPTGMGPTTTRTDLLPEMLAAVLAGRPRPQTTAAPSRTPLWSLRSRVPAGWRSRLARALPDRVVAEVAARLSVRADWPRVRAFAVPGEEKGYVRVNLRGREREGIVDPAEADELLERISAGLLSFRDADGSPSIAKITRISELAAGATAVARLPDLVIAWGGQPVGRLTGVSSPQYGEIERRGIGTGRSGHHADDAWAIVVPGTSRRRKPGRPIRITDVGATACALLDADTAGLSGEPLLEAA